MSSLEPVPAAGQPEARPLASRFTFEPRQVMALLRQRIVGQDAALAAV
ncbi:AAA family ATPase, partial [Pseudomonas gingeri]|nr:AAA family ATPase [Pseudomonas gingeri]